jgi:hypothetical protein
MPSISCPKCEGDIEYDTEGTDNGHADHTFAAWTQGWAQFEAVTRDGTPIPHSLTHYAFGKTACGCIHTLDELDKLHAKASEYASEPYEP